MLDRAHGNLALQIEQRKQQKLHVRVDAAAPDCYAPQASIDMPSSVSCGTSVDLDVIATDGDFDIASIRWEVDGVLLDASIQEIEISASHEISARVRDSRGATASDVHTIACTPP